MKNGYIFLSKLKRRLEEYYNCDVSLTISNLNDYPEIRIVIFAETIWGLNKTILKDDLFDINPEVLEEKIINELINECLEKVPRGE